MSTQLKQQVKQIILDNEAEMIKFRRELHMHPELSFEEFETTKRIARELDKIGISYKLMEPTGLIADIKGGLAGKTVALRADIDALPIVEESEIEYKSTVEGKMHACGHDTHAAMLLTAAKALFKVKDQLKGTVRLIFQPAEENASGAKKLIAQGCLEGVDNIFGEHIWSQSKAGQASSEAGAQMAAADMFFIKFQGRGGHGAMPHATVDAAMMASTFAVNAQTIVSRTVDPFADAVVTIGRIAAGTRFNVIADVGEVDGTVRTMDADIRNDIESALDRYAKAVADMYQGSYSCNYIRGTDIVYNNKESSDRAKRLIVENFGEEALYAEPKTMGGEDFGAYSDIVPGTFAIIGACSNEDTGWAHHHPRFNVDESALKMGSQLYALYAVDYLNG